MPLISSFFGILIKMYFRYEDKHHSPHFHAKYQNEVMQTSNDYFKIKGLD